MTTTAANAAHTTTVRPTTSNAPVRAECSCGWRSDPRNTAHAAETLAFYHREYA